MDTLLSMMDLVHVYQSHIVPGSHPAMDGVAIVEPQDDKSRWLAEAHDRHFLQWCRHVLTCSAKDVQRLGDGSAAACVCVWSLMYRTHVRPVVHAAALALSRVRGATRVAFPDELATAVMQRRMRQAFVPTSTHMPAYAWFVQALLMTGTYVGEDDGFGRALQVLTGIAVQLPLDYAATRLDTATVLLYATIVCDVMMHWTLRSGASELVPIGVNFAIVRIAWASLQLAYLTRNECPQHSLCDVVCRMLSAYPLSAHAFVVAPPTDDTLYHVYRTVAGKLARCAMVPLLEARSEVTRTVAPATPACCGHGPGVRLLLHDGTSVMVSCPLVIATYATLDTAKRWSQAHVDLSHFASAVTPRVVRMVLDAGHDESPVHLCVHYEPEAGCRRPACTCAVDVDEALTLLRVMDYLGASYQAMHSVEMHMVRSLRGSRAPPSAETLAHVYTSLLGQGHGDPEMRRRCTLPGQDLFYVCALMLVDSGHPTLAGDALLVVLDTLHCMNM